MRRRFFPPPPSPSPAPAPSPASAPPFLLSATTTNTTTPPSSSSSKAPVEFSPPLIAMVVIIITAFIVIAYSRLLSRQFLLVHRRYLRWRRRRRRYVPSSSASNFDSPTYPFDHHDAAFHVFSPYGLDDTAIKTIPLSVHTRKSAGELECAVCLLEFEEDDYVRTLPVCSHAFHVDCIDIWLKSHANCPLCRAVIFRPESPFIPVMATRIRPSLDDIVLENVILEPLTEIVTESESDSDGENEIITASSPRRISAQYSEFNRPDFLLKRSYSFGFERNLGSERLVMEAVTASPWRYRRGNGGGVGSFWNKRPSPFSSLTKPRVFSFRYYKGMNMKSPFFRRRNFYPLSERYGGSTSAGGGGSSRRSNKSFASPMFLRGSSRHRSGDPEALLSPERYSKR